MPVAGQFIRSALVANLTLPMGVLMAFAGMHALGIGSNIMSLGGIAIALGAMVDSAIVMIENAHKHVERLAPGGPRGPALIAAAREVGPSLFFSLLLIVRASYRSSPLRTRRAGCSSPWLTPRPSRGAASPPRSWPTAPSPAAPTEAPFTR